MSRELAGAIVRVVGILRDLDDPTFAECLADRLRHEVEKRKPSPPRLRLATPDN